MKKTFDQLETIVHPNRAAMGASAGHAVAFLDELEAHGIETGNYNIPGWEGAHFKRFEPSIA